MKDYRAGIYLRLSREHQDENNSIEAQRQITRNYAVKNSFNVIQEYIDNGYSGILNSRPALNKMMVDISKGLINMVIVKDISRLTRDKNKTGWYTEVFFPDNDVRFISVTEFMDSGNRYEIDDSIMIRGMANQYYIEDISKKVKANKKAMKEAGQYVEYHVPYGYKKADNNCHKIIVDKEVSNNIKLIFDMYIDGKSGNQIAKDLNAKKIKNPSRYLNMKNASKSWSAETVNNILSNPIYIGNTIMNKYSTNYLKKTCKRNKEGWIIQENTHEAIIDKDEYEIVQKIKQKKRGGAKTSQQYLLKDLVYCGHCQYKAQYKIYKSDDKSGFKCGIVYKKPEKCNNKTLIKEKDINKIVIDEIKKTFKKVDINKAVNQVREYYKNKTELAQEYKKVKSEIEKSERKKKILYEKKCEGTIETEKFKMQYQLIKEKLKKLQFKNDELEKEIKKKTDKDNIKEVLLKFQEWEDISNEFIKEFIRKVEIYSNNKICIIFKI